MSFGNAQKYSVNQHLIETLVSWVRSQEIAIPEIQRPFVWKPVQVRDLLDSLYQGYPVGYIIVWRSPEQRTKDGSLAQGRKILIDGQQRVMALQSAILGQPVLDSNYEERHIRIAFHPGREKPFEVQNAAIRQDGRWIADIGPIMRDEVNLLSLVREYCALNPDVDEELLYRKLERLKSILKKQVGVIELAADLDIETVTEIFIRINREGVRLSQADFAMSKIAAEKDFGGPTLRKAIDYFCHAARHPEFIDRIPKMDPEFAKTPHYSAMAWLRRDNDDLYDPRYQDMLTVAFVSRFARGRLSDLVALLSGRDFATRSFRREIAKQSFARLTEGVAAFMNEMHFKRFLMILKSAGFVDRRLVHGTITRNFAHALYLRLCQQGCAKAEIERLVRRWFVLSLLTGRYSASSESQYEEDIRHAEKGRFADYLRQVEETELSETFWEVNLPEQLETTSVVNPAFRVFTAAQVRENTRGFLSSDITVRSMIEHSGDRHHIFPVNFLKKHGYGRDLYDQVANLVYTQTEINIAIADRPPSAYLGTVLEQCRTRRRELGGIVDEADLRRNLEENAIPLELLDDRDLDYKSFLTARRRLMARRIRQYYQSL